MLVVLSWVCPFKTASYSTRLPFCHSFLESRKVWTPHDQQNILVTVQNQPWGKDTEPRRAWKQRLPRASQKGTEDMKGEEQWANRDSEARLDGSWRAPKSRAANRVICEDTKRRGLDLRGSWKSDPSADCWEHLYPDGAMATLLMAGIMSCCQPTEIAPFSYVIAIFALARGLDNEQYRKKKKRWTLQRPVCTHPHMLSASLQRQGNNRGALRTETVDSLKMG